jgi:class 3 adenylate cyclase
MSQFSTRTLETPVAGGKTRKRREFHYRWQWRLRSSPEALWVYVADTDRFNRDTHVPAITMLDKRMTVVNNRRRLKMHRFNILGLKLFPIEWDEDPFEWIRPHRFGVVRNYLKGPVKQMRVQVEMTVSADGGTDAVYHVWITPANLFGYMAIPFQVGLLSGNDFRRVFKKYDALVQAQQEPALELGRSQLAPGGKTRLENIRQSLIAQGADAALVAYLLDLVERGDDLTLMRIRPYALADMWGVPRRQMLEVCLRATRAGLLNFKWEVLCPLCRGAKETDDHLNTVNPQVHCEACNIDFEVNFEYSVELTFRPNPAVRVIEDALYCIGGPQVTPHIAAQALVPAGSSTEVTPVLEAGRYRVRTLSLPGGEPLVARENGGRALWFSAGSGGWRSEERESALQPMMIFENKTNDEQLFVLERMAWSDQAATAADVTALQMFRDLFANEALNPSVQLSVGSITIMFTDLKSSTRLYRDIGDAPAFGLVMDHFEITKTAVAEFDGVIIKILGDAVMAAFRRPVNAVRAALRAQAQLANPPEGIMPLALKVGINNGAAIAVTLNERLDYFGSTVNMAARLTELSRGDDVIIADSIYSDPEVTQFFTIHDVSRFAEPMITPLRGFDNEVFRLYRVGMTQLNG